MQNLAGNRECDDIIKTELDAAEIPVVVNEQGRNGGEVSYLLIGRLGPFEFRRAWYYWMVEGPVPLKVAQEMYAHKNGCRDVRVSGHCGCPPPEEWATGGFVRNYHIDTQEGLDLFARTVRAHGLVGED